MSLPFAIWQPSSFLIPPLLVRLLHGRVLLPKASFISMRQLHLKCASFISNAPASSSSQNAPASSQNAPASMRQLHLKCASFIEHMRHLHRAHAPACFIEHMRQLHRAHALSKCASFISKCASFNAPASSQCASFISNAPASREPRPSRGLPPAPIQLSIRGGCMCVKN